MLLRLRFSEVLWAKVSRRQPDFDRTLERFLQSTECRMVEEPEPVRAERAETTASGTVRHVIVADGFEFRLHMPSCGWWDWDIVDLLPAVERDVAGVQIEDEVIVYRPEDVFRGELAFVIKRRNYRSLASHLKAPINLAWDKVRRGRDARRLFWNDDVIFLLTPKRDGNLDMAQDAVKDLEWVLESTGAGCLIVDPYELKKVREMAGKFGEAV